MAPRMITIRQLDRWQTFWHLCWIGAVDVAIVLAVQVLKEQAVVHLHAARTGWEER
ncbi:MAG TPA: hypothetical protein VI653_09530 [Steroidobacteraceae bacterium]